MMDLPVRRYEGDVRLVEAPADLERALADILADEVVGFDTETRPAFRKGESYLPSLAQVATGRAVYLFQLQRMDFSAPMGAILGADGTVKAGVSLADDLKNLRKMMDFEPRAVVDVGHMAKRHGLKQTGVRNLAGMFLGFRIPKGAKTTNWAAPRLSAQQIQYAATDAWACRELLLRFRHLGIGA
jgi:ribonuclease D